MATASKSNNKKNRKTTKLTAKRAAILKAAETIFAKKGFHEATVSDIAKRAHVSEATIYEYFASKEELLFSIPAETIRDYKDKNREILQYARGAANKLRILINRHFSLYASNEDYATITMLMLKGNRNFLKTESYKVVQASARITTEVLEEGIKSGEFRSDLHPHLVRAMIWGSIEHLVTRKSLLGKPEDLMSLVEPLSDTILQGIEAPGKEPLLNVHITLEDTVSKKE